MELSPGFHLFPAAGPSIWNSLLPTNLQQPDLVIHWFQTGAAEDIFILSVGAKRSVNRLLTALQKHLLTYLLTRLQLTLTIGLASWLSGYYVVLWLADFH